MPPRQLGGTWCKTVDEHGNPEIAPGRKRQNMYRGNQTKWHCHSAESYDFSDFYFSSLLLQGVHLRRTKNVLDDLYLRFRCTTYLASCHNVYHFHTVAGNCQCQDCVGCPKILNLKCSTDWCSSDNTTLILRLRQTNLQYSSLLLSTSLEFTTHVQHGLRHSLPTCSSNHHHFIKLPTRVSVNCVGLSVIRGQDGVVPRTLQTLQLQQHRASCTCHSRATEIPLHNELPHMLHHLFIVSFAETPPTKNVVNMLPTWWFSSFQRPRLVLPPDPLQPSLSTLLYILPHPTRTFNVPLVDLPVRHAWRFLAQTFSTFPCVFLRRFSDHCCSAYIQKWFTVHGPIPHHPKADHFFAHEKCWGLRKCVVLRGQFFSMLVVQQLESLEHYAVVNLTMRFLASSTCSGMRAVGESSASCVFLR